MGKIRFIKDGFFGIKEGDVLEVVTTVDGNALHTEEVVKASGGVVNIEMEDIKGFYEEIND